MRVSECKGIFFFRVHTSSVNPVISCENALSEYFIYTYEDEICLLSVHAVRDCSRSLALESVLSSVVLCLHTLMQHEQGGQGAQSKDSEGVGQLLF